jgi:hypothetical protein
MEEQQAKQLGRPGDDGDVRWRLVPSSGGRADGRARREHRTDADAPPTPNYYYYYYLPSPRPRPPPLQSAQPAKLRPHPSAAPPSY